MSTKNPFLQDPLRLDPDMEKKESKENDSPLPVDEIVTMLLKEYPVTHLYTLASVYAHKGGAVVPPKRCHALIGAFSYAMVCSGINHATSLRASEAIENLTFQLRKQTRKSINGIKRGRGLYV